MELDLSLGNGNVKTRGFCMELGRSMPDINSSEVAEDDDFNSERREKVSSTSSPEDPSPSPAPAPSPPPRLQLDLLPFSPVPRTSHPPPPLRFPWLQDNLSSEPGSSDGPGTGSRAVEAEEQSSPNSGTSSLMEFSLYTSTTNSGGSGGKGARREREEEGGEKNDGQEVVMMELGRGGGGSEDDDENENGNELGTRKKLRLSKEQSAFLEESFKEHHTLNPKQKLALAKQLNLRPRQVEVWFQNRRARTKLKQTEVDCEYLKRCCETLTEDNRRLQKELLELRALKTSQPFFMHLPPTTLTMCPSCERVAPTSTSTSTSVPATAAALSLGKPKPMLPFSNNAQAHQAAKS